MQLIKDILAICAFILAFATYGAWDEVRHQKMLNDELLASRTGVCELVQDNETHVFEDCRITPTVAYINTY